MIYRGRTESMNKYKERFATETSARTLADAVAGADVFYGLSAADVLKPEMLATMAERPLVFAMANPDPEINYELARATRPDAIIATGRSDYPNQINNVLGFPFIFRGALDVRARTINEEMKVAAAHALAALAREDVPDSVLRAYGLESLRFGPEYIVPKPLDPRLIEWVPTAVAAAAMATGVARKQLDLDAYREQLAIRLGKGEQIRHYLTHCAAALGRQQADRLRRGRGAEDPARGRAAGAREDRPAHPAGPARGDPPGAGTAGAGLLRRGDRPRGLRAPRRLRPGLLRAAPAQGRDAAGCAAAGARSRTCWRRCW